MSHIAVALVGNPNCGKTALFNALTGGKAKVGNYPGVTVESKEGTLLLPSGPIQIVDLPGSYSLEARTPDEEVTRDLILNRSQDLILAVVDATQLQRSLAFILELKTVHTPMVLVLNMMDLARERGLSLDLGKLSGELGVPVMMTDAIHHEGIPELIRVLEAQVGALGSALTRTRKHSEWQTPQPAQIRERFAEVDRILSRVVRTVSQPMFWTDRIDQVVLHPVWGSLLLLLVLAFMFQAIFAWAQIPMEWIKLAVATMGHGVESILSPGPLRSLLVDGILSGVGAVLVFLPQILILFLFILFLEDSGYLPRAAFLMDHIMGKVGLHGRAFIPLLSSHACAIPGIMATRTIENKRDRLITILVSPLMTCSARLPVYSLLIAAFIPNTVLFGWMHLQGLVMLLLYLSGVVAGLCVAFLFRRTLLRGPTPTLLLELPAYKWPSFKNLWISLIERARLFLGRAGTVILSVSIVLWFLASYPLPPVDADASKPAIFYSFAGYMGRALEPVLKPLGFDWKIAVALVPGFAAREVMIGALATVYAVEDHSEGGVQFLVDCLARDFSLATGLSLLVWYVLSCQCLSTLAVTCRETNSWRWPAFMLGYMTILAYFGSFLTYHGALALGWG